MRMTTIITNNNKQTKNVDPLQHLNMLHLYIIINNHFVITNNYQES